jgi:hypothetical protein
VVEGPPVHRRWFQWLGLGDATPSARLLGAL